MSFLANRFCKYNARLVYYTNKPFNRIKYTCIFVNKWHKQVYNYIISSGKMKSETCIVCVNVFYVFFFLLLLCKCTACVLYFRTCTGGWQTCFLTNFFFSYTCMTKTGRNEKNKICPFLYNNRYYIISYGIKLFVKTKSLTI